MQLVIVVLAFLCAIVSAMPVNLVKRDVWAPRITSPSAGTVWLAGGKYTVTWWVDDGALLTFVVGEHMLMFLCDKGRIKTTSTDHESYWKSGSSKHKRFRIWSRRTQRALGKGIRTFGWYCRGGGPLQRAQWNGLPSCLWVLSPFVIKHHISDGQIWFSFFSLPPSNCVHISVRWLRKWKPVLHHCKPNGPDFSWYLKGNALTSCKAIGR